ncbi:hypothetical protein GCM10018787_23650 [Streptomyces thermodiastaticus]|nr:hypothetical protein GCM10018787_23650 [Streptomyces thermodiastaticus]
MSGSVVLAAPLGRGIAAFTCQLRNKPTAVINTAAADDPVLRAQAALALVTAGIDVGTILGALTGIRRGPLAQEPSRA